ncbi:hypothetical protein TNCV_1132621 [Trichonephila clavipes]|nr:hypothetical protein TNCV_1132621 [Trichonephila clavipes]
MVFWGSFAFPLLTLLPRLEDIVGLGIPLRSLWPTLHCRRVAGNGSNHLAALREYRRLKDLRKGAISRIGLRKMIMQFERLGIWVCCPEDDGNRLGLKL